MMEFKVFCGRHARLCAGHPRLFSWPFVDGRDKPGHDGAEEEKPEQQRADIGRSSGYITPARHVRAFGV
jgi:hypothetical protein